MSVMPLSKIASGGSDDRVGPDKNSKSTAKKKSKTPINLDDIPGRLSSSHRCTPLYQEGLMSHLTLVILQIIMVPERQVCTSYDPHTFRPPTDIGTSRLSSGTSSCRDSSPHLSGLWLRDSSNSDAQTSTPLFSEPWILPRVASASGFAPPPPPPPPPVTNDTDAHLVGLVPRDKDRLGRVFIEPDGSMWHPALKEVNKEVRESVRRLFSQPWHSWMEIPEDHRQAMFEEFKALSEQNKKSRASLKDGSLHTEGAKSVNVIVREMTNESDPDVWVEPRAENANNEYIRCLSEFGSTQPTQEEVNKIWTKKVAGGKKKGKTYGFSSQNELRRLRAGWVGIGSSSQAEAVDGVQLATMLQQITDLSRAFAQSVAQNEVMGKSVKDLKK
ncbi:hypothetical protein FXO38_28663, partial [Capsicum annuum]